MHFVKISFPLGNIKTTEVYRCLIVINRSNRNKYQTCLIFSNLQVKCSRCYYEHQSASLWLVVKKMESFMNLILEIPQRFVMDCLNNIRITFTSLTLLSRIDGSLQCFSLSTERTNIYVSSLIHLIF